MSIRELHLGWRVPADYKRREIFVGELGRCEIEVISDGIKCSDCGHLTKQEFSESMDWSAMVIASIRRELGV